MKIKATLQRKLAGMPVYVWLALVLAAVLLGILLRRRGSGQATATEQEFGGFPARGQEEDSMPGTAGGGLGGGGVGSTTEPQRSSAEPVFLPLPDLPSIGFGGGGAPDVTANREDTTSRPAPVSTGDAANAQTPGPAPAPKAQAPAGRQSFTWVFGPTTFRGEKLPGKTTWYREDKPLFLKHLGARGQTYAGWKAGHSSAACRVFGDC